MGTSEPEKHQTAGHIDWPKEFAQHQRWLRTVVYARLRDVHAIDDVMQEVALAAIKQTAPIRDATKVAPWLYRLAVLQALLYRRKRGRTRKLADRFASRQETCDPLVGRDDPLGWLLANERQQLVREALGRLASRDAELLLLKYTEDWSYLRIAQHLGTSPSAIEARLHRARSRLRAELAAMNVVESQ